MTTFATCPHCGTTTALGITFTDVTFGGNAMNVAVTCSNCQRKFDAAPGDGTYSTIGGRLRRVREGVRVFVDELNQDPHVAAVLAELVRQQSRMGTTPDLLAEQLDSARGGSSAFASWLRENEWVASWLGLLLTVILAVVDHTKAASSEPATPPPAKAAVQMPNDNELDRIIQQAISDMERGRPEQQQVARRPGRAPARNSSCPCGSGLKFKRCHGTPGSRP